MKIPLLLVFLLITVNAYMQEKKIKDQDHNLNKALKLLKEDKDLKNASIGFLAIDIKTGETIAEMNPDLSRMPASTQKLVTTATALEVLGKNFRYSTNLQYTGTIDTAGKILNGDIYIRGGADPTLGSKYFDKEKNYSFIKDWINSLRANKIESINGRIIADASIFGTEINPPRFLWEDIGNYYGAGANGLTAFDNLYEIHLSSPAQPDSLTTVIKTDPEIPGLVLYNEVLSSKVDEDKAFVFGAPYTYLYYIRGTLPVDQKDYVIKGAIPDPAYFLAWRFKLELENAGIHIQGEATTDRLLRNKGDSLCSNRKDIHVIYSPGLISIINVTNRRSINLFAEHLFNQVAYKLKNKGTTACAIETVTDFWKNKGMDTDGFYIFDGSGLSPYNAISPRHFVFVLTYMATKSKNFKEFYESLPVAGKSGTLSYVGKNTSAEGVVHAKSGSIDRVRAYSGYVSTKSGRTLAFSMNITNYNCSDGNAVGKLASLMVEMAEFSL